MNDMAEVEVAFWTAIGHALETPWPWLSLAIVVYIGFMAFLVWDTL